MFSLPCAGVGFSPVALDYRIGLRCVADSASGAGHQSHRRGLISRGFFETDGNLMQELNRRQFVAQLGVLAAGACLAGGCAANDPLAWSGPVDFDLGPASQVKEGVDAQWATSGGFLLVREGPKMYAVSAICSHKACGLLPPGAKAEQLQCPCHGSRFTRQGKVLNGPATTSLVHFGISTNAAGHVLIDRRKMYPEPRWDEPGAFVTV